MLPRLPRLATSATPEKHSPAFSGSVQTNVNAINQQLMQHKKLALNGETNRTNKTKESEGNKKGGQLLQNYFKIVHLPICDFGAFREKLSFRRSGDVFFFKLEELKQLSICTVPVPVPAPALAAGLSRHSLLLLLSWMMTSDRLVRLFRSTHRLLALRTDLTDASFSRLDTDNIRISKLLVVGYPIFSSRPTAITVSDFLGRKLLFLILLFGILPSSPPILRSSDPPASAVISCRHFQNPTQVSLPLMSRRKCEHLWRAADVIGLTSSLSLGLPGDFARLVHFQQFG